MIPLSMAILVICTLAAVPAAAHSDHETTESFRVMLEEDGDAEIVLTLTFDLADEDEQAAFASLEDDVAAQEEIRDRFANRMAAVAEDAAAATDREMSVSDASITLTTNDRVGVVELSIRWSNLAAVEGNSLTVNEPFASGFVPDQEFILVAPEGYAVSAVTPTPDERTEATLTWDAGTDLSRFDVTLVAEDGPEQPGFGPGVTVLALLAATLSLIRRRA